MNEEQNIAIEGVLKLYTASMLNDIKKDPLKAVNKIQENLAEILKLKIEKNNLQNRIDKAIEELEKDYENLPFIDEYYSNDKQWHNYFFCRNEQAENSISRALDILKESGE